MTTAEAIVASTPDTPAPAPVSAPSVRFTGDTRAYWRLQLRGALLLAVTLGIYRFWLATDVRRFLWANSEVAGEPLEYTGTATELLVGFLIAIAILVPLNLMIAIAALGAGDLGALVSILALPLLFFLGQFALYRARRYRLTRTVYRGVRCHQDGSALRYAVCAVFWWSLVVLTLGLAYPFLLSRLERFKLRHTYFGDLKGRFEGSGFKLLLRGLPMWLLVIGPLVLAAAYTTFEVEWFAIIAAGSVANSSGEFLNAIEGVTNLYTAVALCVTALVFSVVAAAVLFPVFQAMVLRWWIGGLRLGGLTIRSQLRTAPIYGGYLRFLGYGLLFVAAVAVAAGLATALSFLVEASISSSVAAEAINAAMAVGIYVITMLGFSAIYHVTVKLTLWRAGMESIALDGADVLERVKAEGALSSAVGEGLADALNMGGI